MEERFNVKVKPLFLILINSNKEVFFMNPFEKLMKDIFSNNHFLQKCTIENTEYNCVISSTDDSVVYADAGLENGVSFTIDLKLPVYPMPKVNNKVFYKSNQYKISAINVDSANQSIKLSLISVSKPNGA